MFKRLYFLFFTALVCLSPALNAQLLRSYGVKAGVVSASQSFDYSAASGMSSNDLGQQRRAGVSAGVYGEWLNLPGFSIVTQLEYRQGGTGFKYLHTGPNGEDLGNTVEYYRIDYLSLGVFAKARLPGAVAAPYLLAGPRLDHLLSFSPNRGLFSLIYEEYQKNIPGFSLGGGIELQRILPVKLQLEARYNMDLRDSYNSDWVAVRNNSFGVWLGVGF